MCGIVGIIGDKNVQEVLINGLERLEYRGYDSAGIFLLNHEEDNFQLTKEVGRIEALKAKVDFTFPAEVGIGHTRWATHGPATLDNAHPHTSPNGRFVLVHNGVIENYNELRQAYLENTPIQSNTDTEIVVALIENFVENDHLSTQDAFQKALSLIEGSYAFGLIDKENSDVLYAAKNKSPLLVGKGDGFNAITSDAMATIDLTHEYIEIKDKEIIVLKEDAVTITNLQGESVQRDPYVAELDPSDLGKGAYPYYMIKEIDEQPAVLRRLIQTYQDQNGQFVVDDNLKAALQNSDRLYIVACGTSYHAGWVGKNLFEKQINIPTEIHLASEFAYNPPLMSEKPFFIFLSQSGETADSRQALVLVNQLGHPSLTITNVKGSTLSREATYTLLLHAGPEIAVASTKAYTAQITVMAILAAAVGQTQQHGLDLAHELSIAATNMETILAEKDQIKAWVDENLLETPNAFYIGRFLDYYVSMEAALKLKEISYIQTEAFASGELKHGTIALIEEGTPVIAIISQAKVDKHTRGNLEEVKARGAKTCVIATQDFAQPGDQFVLPKTHALLTPLVIAVMVQLIAYYTSLGKGLDVDKPRNLAKSVTVE
ncbi:glutamine--fructose-6-phosphate transaminase (isomerizing) [Fundicoccus culcitae]|uniref:Glutamine--fructose-6-phosphate aminotransferase [isomerizing] n=1 Tax=Fundicoccus culcitae TaxID=2969821 RepID=A0ABY5P5P4_9LACT|nr:glutamine--fructose-6-phosphate transaminase (isomerizing) [Fundicoccus culcitae]UUX33869.1 glutamine--fructose-6-phosphate transaminase (isomerizing) [Fundicoccus culcitae]